ncbi:type IV secretory system conjugative DNA transfer family protein [Streptomyces violascens]|uniref:type IV secretory system conjugative DNA transfer family protein n=1 Tax=Streptomyces violascens TaxID=67381 RepID=UPI0036C805C1
MSAPVDLTKPGPEHSGDGELPAGQARFVQRAELVLALADQKPLAHLGLSPDPLQQLAAAMASVRTEAGERAEVVVDLVPVGERRLARRRRRLLARSRRRGPSAYGERLAGGLGGAGVWESMSAAWSGGKSAGTASGAKRLPRMTDLKAEVGKFDPAAGAVFGVQILLRTQAPHPQQALARMNQLLAAFSITSGENHLRTRRPRTGRAVVFFDRRFATGEFAPVRRQWMTVAELAGFLKPPTRSCSASSVVRSGGLVPPAPADLPLYTGQPGLVPLGAVVYPDGVERIAAARAADLLFALMLGKAGHGKTEAALVQCIALAHTGHGCWFLDPHGEAWDRAKPYLAHTGLMDRIWEINLGEADPDQMVVSWNPLSMEGRKKSDIQKVVRAVTEAIAAAQGWGDQAPRAHTILARACQAIALLNYEAVRARCPQAQGTLFQLRRWLIDEEWRGALLAHLPGSVQRYWLKTFADMPSEAVPTVTYAIDRLDTSPSLQAFFGSPRSGYDVRTAMDTGKVVFLCPDGSEADALVSCLLIHDLYRAGRSRQDTHRSKRRTFWAWGDELTAVDSSSKGFLAAIAEQLRKYEVRFFGMTQMALRLSAITRQALMQNQSMLSTCAADYDEAAYVARRWNGQVTPETITELPKYHQIMSITLNGRRTSPFRVRGLPVEEVFTNYRNPDGVPALDEAIDQNLNRRPLKEILAELEDLDDVILAHHNGSPSASPATTADDPTTRYDDKDAA